MALFFNFKTQQASSDVPATVLHSAWHPEQSVLAVAMDNCVVSLFNEEGDKHDPNGVVRSNTQCSCLAWHPKHKLLCTGWRDGAVVLWSGEDGSKESTPIHAGNAVTVLCWNAAGTRLLSADASGQLGVWKMDQKNRLTPMIQHKKTGSISHVVFRTTKNSGAITELDGELEMEDLDLEAGGEGKPNPAAKFNKDCIFFFGGVEGSIYMADDSGNIQVCTSGLEAPLAALLYHQNKDGVVCLTQGMQLAYWTLDTQFHFQQVMKVKVSAASSGGPGGQGPASMLWVGPDLLVTSNHEGVLRFWNLFSDENYLLQLTEQEDKDESRKGVVERIACISFNRRKRVLASGTREGRIVFWQFVGGDNSLSYNDWEAFAEIDVDAGINDIQWGPGETLLSASMQDCVSILHETVLKRKMCGNTTVVQLSPECVFVETTDKSHPPHTVKSGLRIKGLDLFGSHFCVWDNKHVELYSVQASGVSPVNQFEANPTTVAIHSESIFIAKSNRIEVFNHQVHKKQTLQLTESEGEPVCLDVHGDFLCAATTKRYLRMWRLGRDAKPHGVPKRVFDSENIEITSVRCNFNGKRVSILAKLALEGGHTMADTKLYVYDVESDKILHYDFNGVQRYPISHCWDETEPRLLGCETRRYRSVAEGEGQESEDGETSSRIEVATLFVNAEKGAVLQDSFPLDRSLTALVGMTVPSFYFYARFPSNEGTDTHLEVKPMPNFGVIDCSDPKVKEALVNFSYHLTMGNMDEAYKAVKSIKDENVWHNMAAMCVKTKRLDVAEMCLGNMQDAKAAKALREAKKEPELDAQVAALAIHLELVEDAEKLYKSAKRYDLLNKLYEACGNWDLAIQTAEKYDRIHIRTIHYGKAQCLEQVGDIEGAVKEYELSKNHRYEVPRMLFDMNQIPELESYLRGSEDKELLGWWAQYNESVENFDEALAYYQRAGDILAQVRLHCFLNEFDQARAVVEDSESRSAAYHLARQYEDQGMAMEAIKYFHIAKSFRHAITIAKEHAMDTEVLQLSLKASSHGVMVDAAEYFESKGMMDKAVLLYQRGGNLSKAVMLCVKGKLFDVLNSIADDVQGDADPEVFLRCADFFLENDQFERATGMLINAQAFERALGVCLERNVTLTDEMAEQMTLPKGGDEDSEAYRLRLLKKVAKVAKIQENWALACKKYTQAGEKMKAMQMLLKSGDKERIIFFAQHSRQPELYIMAANFLQNLDWHSDPAIMKTIISFYTKAKALESLAIFYDACAQVEIDEYRDYEKALSALREAHRFMSRAKLDDKEKKVQELDDKIVLVERFVMARSLVKTNSDEMVRVCKELLDSETEGAVRIGDVYALLVEFYSSQGSNDEAFQLIEQMRDRDIVLSYYLEQSLVEAVYTAMGVGGVGGEDEVGEEEIAED